MDFSIRLRRAEDDPVAEKSPSRQSRSGKPIEPTVRIRQGDRIVRIPVSELKFKPIEFETCHGDG